jgi:glycine oxidase
VRTTSQAEGPQLPPAAAASAPDLVVVGGGPIGLATAWRCAQAGMDVAIVDAAPARGAVWAAAGMLAPVTEVHYGEEELLRLNLASSTRWPAFAEELAAATDRDLAYRPSGTLVVARDRDDGAVLDDLHAFQRRLGLEAERLGGRDARRLEPALAPRTRGAILVPGDHQVDNRALADALVAVCGRAGVHGVPTPAASLLRDGDRVSGVRTDDGREIRADAVLLAAGAASGRMEGLPAGTVPVRPVKGQLLHLRRPPWEPAEPIATRTIRGLDVYVVARADGRVVVGATVEERGEDRTITAGAVLHLLHAAWELLPGLAEYELVEAVAGLRPGTPDNRPLLGWTALPGLAVATGHYRNGVLLTPVTAELLRDLLTGGGDIPEPFDPRRFAGTPRMEEPIR